MNLEDVTVELRPRSEWEAADLGVRMVRRDAAAIYKVWFTLTLVPFLLAIAAIVFTPFDDLAVLLLWWLEPATDGPILHIISRRLFGEKVGVRATLREVPRLIRRNWIFLLSPYRFHFARSIAVPVTQLEGLTGAARRARAKILNQKIMNFGTGVTVAYQHLALSLYFGGMLIAVALLPTAYQDTIGLGWLSQLFTEDDTASSIASLALVYAAQSALHPWFVGSGFGLYINCRTQLEAWDVEVAFRRMVQRRAIQASILVCLALVLPTVMAPTSAEAQEEPGPAEESTYEDTGFTGYWNDDDVDSAMKTVTGMEALRTERDVQGWQKRQKTEEDESQPTSIGPLTMFFRAIGGFFSIVFEFGLWIAALILLALIVATRDSWLHFFRRQPRRSKGGPRVLLAGGEITAADLPEDIPAEVRKLWRSGNRRSALSLLFRGSVFAAVTRHGVRLPPSATESACIAAVSRRGDQKYTEYFRSIVDAWVWCAYGSIDPADDELLRLCDEWPQHYGDVT